MGVQKLGKNSGSAMSLKNCAKKLEEKLEFIKGGIDKGIW